MKKPETTIKVGNIRGSIFLHKNTNGQTGQDFSSYSVHLHRRYEESPGVWKSTSYFRFFELPQVALVLKLCTAYVADREATVVSTQANGSTAQQEDIADASSSNEDSEESLVATAEG